MSQLWRSSSRVWNSPVQATSSQRLMTMKLTSKSISWLARNAGTSTERSWSPISRAKPTVRTGSPSSTVSHQPGFTRQWKARRKRLRTPTRPLAAQVANSAAGNSDSTTSAAGEFIGCDMQRGRKSTAGDHAVVRQTPDERQSVAQGEAEDEERRERKPRRQLQQPAARR